MNTPIRAPRKSTSDERAYKQFERLMLRADGAAEMQCRFEEVTGLPYLDSINQTIAEHYQKRTGEYLDSAMVLAGNDYDRFLRRYERGGGSLAARLPAP